MATTPTQSPTTKRVNHEAYLSAGRWTVDNSEHRISHSPIQSPRRSALKGSQTPHPSRSPIFSISERLKRLEDRRVRFAQSASIRHFEQADMDREATQSPIRSSGLDSSVFDEDPNTQEENPFLERLRGSPSNQRKRRADLFGSPQNSRIDKRRSFNSKEQIMPMSVERDKGIFSRVNSMDDGSPMQLTQEHDRFTQWAEHVFQDTVSTDEPMRLTQNLNEVQDILGPTSMFEDFEDELDMQITQEARASESTTPRSERHGSVLQELKSPRRGSRMSSSYISPLNVSSTKSPVNTTLFSPYRSFYLHESRPTSANPTPLREDVRASPVSIISRELTADHSIISDYGDRMASIHNTHHANILDEEFPQLYDSFTDETPLPPKNMSLSEFLQYVGINFSTESPLQEGRRASRLRVNPQEPVETTDKAVAAINVIPELECYREWCKELENFIKHDRDTLRKIDEDVSENNPQFFAEYLDGSPQLRNEMESKFKQVKQFALLKTMKIWYEWRQEKINQLSNKSAGHLERLRQDLGTLKELKSKIATCQPGLSVEREKQKEALKEAQKREAAYHQIDQQQLADLMEEIETQKITLEEFENDKSKADHNLEELKKKETLYKDKVTAMEKTIKVAKETRERHQCITDKDLVEVRDHFRSCIKVLNYKLENQSKELINIRLDDGLDVVLNKTKLESREPDAVLIRLLDTRDRELGPFAELLHGLQGLFADRWNTTDIMQDIAIYWNRVKMIKREMTRVQRRFWFEAKAIESVKEPDERGVMCSITVSSYVGQTKFTVSFVIRAKDVMSWPDIDTTQISVKLGYGHVSQDEMEKLVRHHLDKHGMVDCVEHLRTALDNVLPVSHSADESS